MMRLTHLCFLAAFSLGSASMGFSQAADGKLNSTSTQTWSAIDSFWDLLNTKLGLLVVGFILTTTCGALLSAWIQKRNWKRQFKVTIFQKRYDEGAIWLDDLSNLVGLRYFATQRYFWSIKNSTAYNTIQIEEEYFNSVKEWNIKLRTMRNKARLLLGEDWALKFLDYSDDSRPKNPLSLHYKFSNAHSDVIEFKNNIGHSDEAARGIEQLNFTCSYFLEQFTTEFLRKSKQLCLIEIPDVEY